MRPKTLTENGLQKIINNFIQQNSDGVKNNNQFRTRKKVYFASDQHFGAPTPKESRVREEKFIRWMDEIKEDAQVLFLMGDLFDFWHEWKHVVPKGYVRVLGKLQN
jgi:UDP-2,3-diacylglucosamine hydrolase